MKAQEKLILNIRDIWLRDNFTASEKINFITLFSIFLLLTCNIDSRSTWTSCIILVIGSSSLVNIKIHELVHPFNVDRIWTKLLYINLPAIFLLVIYFLTALGKCAELMSINGVSFIVFTQPKNIFCTNIDFRNNFILFLSTISLYAVCTHLLLIPKSLHFINKFLSWCCKSLFYIILLALIFKAADSTKQVFGIWPGYYDSFFCFAYDGDWAAFALLWMYVSYSIAILEYNKKFRKFRKTKTLFHLIICTLIASTTFLIQASTASFFLSFAFTHICYLTYKYFKKENKHVLKLICPYIYILSTLSLIKGLYTFSVINTYDSEIKNLKKSGLEMISDSPLFGWGINSFQKLQPYYNDASLLRNNYEAIPSSVISFLCEFGFVGTIIICLLPIISFIKYLKKKQINSFSNTLFFALFLICILSFFDNPFYNIPVTFSFWVIGFLSIRWAQLIYNRPDEVDTVKNLITYDQLRKVPFVTNPKKEVFK